jgi:hypothetical protein
MSIILPDDRRGGHLPQPRIVITAHRNEIRAVCAERTIPYPALVVLECCRQRERLSRGDCVRKAGRAGCVAVAAGGVGRGGVVRRGELFEVFLVGGAFPDLDGVVGGAGCEFLAVGTEQNAREVIVVGFEDAAGEKRG